MLRDLSEIDADISRCQTQIATTYDLHTPQNTEETMLVREGFQNNLKKLYDEKSVALRNIEIIGV